MPKSKRASAKIQRVRQTEPRPLKANSLKVHYAKNRSIRHSPVSSSHGCETRSRRSGRSDIPGGLNGRRMLSTSIPGAPKTAAFKALGLN